MSVADELRSSLQRLREAFADVDRAASALLAERPAAPPPVETTPAAPAKPASDPLAARLAALHDPALAAGLDPADLVFTRRAGERLAELPEDRKKLLLADCVRLLDALLVKYHLLLPAALRDEGIALAADLAARAGSAAPSGDLRIPGEAPAGKVLAPLAPGRRLVSSGRSGPAAEAFAEAARAAAAARNSDASDRGTALEELMKLWPRLADADAGQELTVLRYAVNALSPAGLEGAAEPLLAFLRKQGVTEITVSVGGLFDDSYGPSRYERRKVPSSAPRNTILSVLQRGFVGSDGSPLQRAVVAVSDGTA